jgi:hypothetical protein
LEASKSYRLRRGRRKLLEILRDAGRERARAALELAAELAKQLIPFSLITVAIVAGLFIVVSQMTGRIEYEKPKEPFASKSNYCKVKMPRTKSLPRVA